MNINEMRANAVTQLYTAHKEEEIRKIDYTIKTIGSSNLSEIKGIGPATIKSLVDKGIKTQEDIKEAGIDRISEIVTNPMSLASIKKFILND